MVNSPLDPRWRTTWIGIGAGLVVLCLALALAGGVAPSVPAQDLLCSDMATLDDLVDCIVSRMPSAEGPDGFAVPSAAALDDWQSVSREMLSGKCEDISLPDTLNRAYVLKSVVDASATHCVLLEVADADGNGLVDRGWGTFIVRSGTARELHIQTPHAVTDRQTETQAIGVYKGVFARSYLMAGTPRGANQKLSSCQIEAYESDAAHNVTMPFHATTLAIAGYFAQAGTDFHIIQFHGMRDTSCPNMDVYMTNGIDTKPLITDKLALLRAAFVRQNPKVVIRMPGEPPPCNLVGDTNVQGRLLNGVPPGIVCTFPLAPRVKPSGKFIHIEQKMAFRNASLWIAPISSVWPMPAVPTQVPTVPTIAPDPPSGPPTPEPEDNY